MRLPIYRITGTAIEFPMALYLRVLGASPFRQGTRVQSSGNPCSRSHSRGVSLRTPHSPATAFLPDA